MWRGEVVHSEPSQECAPHPTTAASGSHETDSPPEPPNPDDSQFPQTHSPGWEGGGQMLRCNLFSSPLFANRGRRARAQSLQPRPTLLDPVDWFLCPWDSPGKSTGVGCHALLQGTSLTVSGLCKGSALPSHAGSQANQGSAVFNMWPPSFPVHQPPGREGGNSMEGHRRHVGSHSGITLFLRLR